ncbi:MAG: YceI family protein [Chitinophagaceae bacterium]
MATTNWILDPAHSEIQFKIKHLMITTVTGQFKKFDVTATAEDNDFSTSKINLTIDIDSISTNNDDRDGHLKSADFFDIATYPQIIFHSTSIEKDGDDLLINGELDMHGVKKPVTLNAEFGGIVVDPYGHTKAGFTVHAKFNRKDFGLVWGAVTEAGNVVLSDEVRLNAEIQLVHQAS